jgi:hypothetical protein
LQAWFKADIPSEEQALAPQLLVVSQLFEGAWEDRVQKQFAPYLAAA